MKRFIIICALALATAGGAIFASGGNEADAGADAGADRGAEEGARIEGSGSEESGSDSSAQTSTSESEASRSELERVVLALDWVPNTNHIGAYIAQDLGFFADAGIEVDIVQPAEASAERLVALGRADFGYSYQEALSFARTSEDALPIVAIAAVIQHNTSGFASRSELNSVADLVGLTYGSWGSPVEEAMLKTLLENEGASLSDMRILNTGAADFFAVTEQEVDVSWVFEGWTIIEAMERGVELSYLDLADINEVFDYYTPIVITSEERIEAEGNGGQNDLVRRFMSALSRGYNYAIQNPLESAAVLHSAVPEIPLNLAEASLQFLADEFTADAERWGEMRPEVWQRYADWLFANGLITQELNVEASFTNEFLPSP